MTAEIIARLVDQYENSKQDNSLIDMNPDETGIDNSAVFLFDDDRVDPGSFKGAIDNNIVEKRPAAAAGRYHYYKCYFNPVTCYRK